jgi:hypothetical protein
MKALIRLFCVTLATCNWINGGIAAGHLTNEVTFYRTVTGTNFVQYCIEAERFSACTNWASGSEPFPGDLRAMTDRAKAYLAGKAPDKRPLNLIAIEIMRHGFVNDQGTRSKKIERREFWYVVFKFVREQPNGAEDLNEPATVVMLLDGTISREETGITLTLQ